MANLQGIRRRIRAVKNMQQITKAMKLVSASKLKKAQDRVTAARPYAQKMTRVINDLASRVSEYKHPLLEKRGDENILLVLITADKGLCGAFNTNLIRAGQLFIKEHPDKKISLFAIGRKGRDFFRRRQVTIAAEHVNLTARAITFAQAAEVAREIIGLFTAEDSIYDKVYLISNEFKSALQQSVVVQQILPIGSDQVDIPTDANEPLTLVDPIFEQPPAEILGELLPKLIETQIYQALLESIASEHGARMTAMDSATRNAIDVVDRLTLYLNRIRQATITNEIIEVVSGAEAL